MSHDPQNNYKSGFLVAPNATYAYEEIAYQVYNDGIETAPRGQKVKEFIGYNLRITDPRNRIVTSPDRKISYRYLLAEFTWYMSGSSYASTIKDYAPFWASIADEDGKVNSNYGFRLFGFSPEVPYNQWEAMKEMLRQDPDTRQAICHINASYDYVADTKDRPCTLTLQWFIRDMKLYLKVNMRSNDLQQGYGNDVFMFSMMQELMLCQLRNEGFPYLELGDYLHDAGSMHIYDRNYKTTEATLANRTQIQPKAMKPMQLKPTDIANLIAIEKFWREDCSISKHASVSAAIQHMTEFQELSEYWQNLILVCFFDFDKALILEA